MQLTISIAFCHEYSRLYNTSRLKSLIFRTKKLLSKTVTAISPKQHMCVNQQATSFALHTAATILFFWCIFCRILMWGYVVGPFMKKVCTSNPHIFYIKTVAVRVKRSTATLWYGDGDLWFTPLHTIDVLTIQRHS